MSVHGEGSAYALLTDGATIEIRAAARRFRCGAGHARQDVPGLPLPAVLQHESDGGRAGGAPDMPRARAGSRGPAGQRDSLAAAPTSKPAQDPDRRRSPSQSPMTCIIVASACCFWSTCSLAGARAATVATPLITRQALFQQGGKSPSRTSASYSTPRRSWPPSRCPPETGSA